MFWCAVKDTALSFFLKKKNYGNIVVDMLLNCIAISQLENLQPNIMFQLNGAPCLSTLQHSAHLVILEKKLDLYTLDCNVDIKTFLRY